MTDTLRDHPWFMRFWLADTVSILGTQITAVAMPVIAITVLGATDAQVGLLNGARWAPYILLGLIAGAVADRVRRQRLLVGTALGRGLLLLAVPMLYAASSLSVPALTAILLAFGALAMFSDAAHQSFVPRIVPAHLLTAANARLIQSESVASLSGPMLAASLLKIVSAPAAIALDALSYLLSGIVIAGLRVTEPRPSTHDRHLRREIREGLAWVYRHPALSWIALTSHARFVFVSMIAPIYQLLMLRDLALGTVAFGLNAALAGIGGLAGGAFAARAGMRLHPGGAITAVRFAVPLASILLVFAPAGPWGWVMTGLCQLVFGLALGIEAPNEMGFRQAITPDRLQGRMNATIRSFNWGMYAAGSALGGILAGSLGNRPALWIAITGGLAAAIALALSPGRTAHVPPPPE